VPARPATARSALRPTVAPAHRAGKLPRPITPPGAAKTVATAMATAAKPR
jgi:hypothetical protein